jgi:hypothetical protein
MTAVYQEVTGMAYKVILTKPNIVVQNGFTLHCMMSLPGTALYSVEPDVGGYKAEIIDFGGVRD